MGAPIVLFEKFHRRLLFHFMYLFHFSFLCHNCGIIWAIGAFGASMESLRVGEFNKGDLD